MPSIRLHLIVDGRVQGVGYRYFARSEARRRDLGGWVRNNDDGSVEIEAQGEVPQIEEFIEILRKGPPSGRVTEIRRTEIPVRDDDNGFMIVF